MDEGDAVLLHELRHLGEILLVMADADMLEHADRDDAVERAFHVAIILQAEIGPPGEAPLLGAAPRHAMLFLRQRHSGDLRSRMGGEVKSHSAPTAANVEHGKTRPIKQQLGGDMALLGQLGIVQRLVGRLEISAGILPVGVEEQRIEPSIEIVMMGDVLLRTVRWVELGEASEQKAQPQEELRAGTGHLKADLRHQQRKHLGDVALLHHHAAFHIGLAEAQFGIEDDLALPGMRGEAHCEGWSAAIPEHGAIAGGEDHGERATAHNAREDLGEQPFHRPIPKYGAAGEDNANRLVSARRLPAHALGMSFICRSLHHKLSSLATLPNRPIYAKKARPSLAGLGLCADNAR